MAYILLDNHVMSIIALSICVNIIVLPLYRRADAMQEEERLIEARLADGVAHIKKTFKGDERMMMLQTYYNQNNYKPIYALKGATSLFLQIPFFIAAYEFLSSYSRFSEVSFGLINDLSRPDGILTIAGLRINILPFIMTAINIVSSRIYSKDMPAKMKAQLYLTAIVFLVLLYNSPSALVFYWTLNNAFSLFKTIVLKTKNKKKTTAILLSVSGVFILLYVLLFDIKATKLSSLILLEFAILLQIPIVIILLKRKNKTERKKKPSFLDNFESSNKGMLAGLLFLTLFIGGYIPSTVIKASPQEFIFGANSPNPIWFVVSSLCIAAGTFLVWIYVFYRFSDNKRKTVIEILVYICCVASIVNFMFFGKSAGTLESDLTFANGDLVFSSAEKLINFIVVLFIAFIVVFAFRLLKSHSAKIIPLMLAFSVTACALSTVNIVNINRSVNAVSYKAISADDMNIKLSKTGKNVVVIMLDRAMGSMVPYLFQEKPELYDSFTGFTYYSNVISYGRSTNHAASALFGGYEYTPIEMNTRSDASLCEKNNEAICLMPVVFGENGYSVTYFNPIYANYQVFSDLSLFDNYPYINAQNVYGFGNSVYEDMDVKDVGYVPVVFRNLYMYSIMKTVPVGVQPLIYSHGSYFRKSNTQIVFNMHRAEGYVPSFMGNFNIISNLKQNTQETKSKGELLILTNDTTHSPQLLQEPEYLPAKKVDNTEYDENNKSRFTCNGLTLQMNSKTNYMHYQINMASLLKIGEWLDYLKEIGVYDNTRIIIVSDHGYGEQQLEQLIIEDYDGEVYNPEKYSSKLSLADGNSYFPLLLVKDFNATGTLKTSDEFMTNADVPTIAFNNIIDNPTNPFTGNPVNSDYKLQGNQYIMASLDRNISVNSGNQFLPARWYSIHDSIWDKDNWQRVADNAVLTKEDAKAFE